MARKKVKTIESDSTTAPMIEGSSAAHEHEAEQVSRAAPETEEVSTTGAEMVSADSILDTEDTNLNGKSEKTELSANNESMLLVPADQAAQQNVAIHDGQPYYHDPMLSFHVQPQSGHASQIPNPPGTKAKRKRASPPQVALLNQIYEYTSFPSTELRGAIGKELGMAPRTVQIWFQNRRQAWKSQKTRDSAENSPRSRDNERGGWEVLRSFQARRANGDISEYEYMAIPSPQSAGADGVSTNGLPVLTYHPGMMQVALSSNDQFNSSMQQLPMPLPHTPRPVPVHVQASGHDLSSENLEPTISESNADVEPATAPGELQALTT